MKDLYAVRSWCLVRDGMGTTCMKLLSYSNSTQRYLLPLLDGMVNWSVWSVKVLLEMGIHAGNTCFLRGSFTVSGVVGSFVARTWRIRVVV